MNTFVHARSGMQRPMTKEKTSAPSQFSSKAVTTKPKAAASSDSKAPVEEGQLRNESAD